MADRILIPFGAEFIALTAEALTEARAAGRALVGMPCASPAQPGSDSEPLLDAEGISARTGVPATWYLEKARRNEIPHFRFEKYVRFRLSEVLKVTAQEVLTSQALKRVK
jgi:hypothetical protein